MHGKDGKTIDREEAGVVFMAWRAIYAEVVRARKEGAKAEAQSGVHSAGQDDAVQNDGSRGKVKKDGTVDNAGGWGQNASHAGTESTS